MLWQRTSNLFFPFKESRRLVKGGNGRTDELTFEQPEEIAFFAKVKPDGAAVIRNLSRTQFLRQRKWYRGWIYFPSFEEIRKTGFFYCPKGFSSRRSCHRRWLMRCSRIAQQRRWFKTTPHPPRPYGQAAPSPQGEGIYFSKIPWQIPPNLAIINLMCVYIINALTKNK